MMPIEQTSLPQTLSKKVNRAQAARLRQAGFDLVEREDTVGVRVHGGRKSLWIIPADPSEGGPQFISYNLDNEAEKRLREARIFQTGPQSH